MNWLNVTLTVALTATTWLGWSDQTPTTTVETALVDPSKSIDLPPVVRAARAADYPPVEYDDLIITTRPMGDCVADCEGDFVYPPPPVFTRIVAAVEMHAAANPQYFRNEGMERLYARLGPVNYEIFGGQYLEYERPNLPLGVPHWEQWSSLRPAAGSSIAWAGVPQGVTTEANGLRHIFTVPGTYTLTATVNAKFDLSMVVRPFCQICWWGRREVVADYKGLAAPALQKTLGVTAVGVGSLELANAGEEIDDGLGEEGEDRIVYLRERWSGPDSGSGPLSAPALPSATLFAHAAAPVMALMAPAPADPAYAVATATPIPDVDDTILAALNWSFTGGEAIAGESEYRKRRASTLIPAVHDFVVTLGPPPEEDDDRIARARRAMFRRMRLIRFSGG